MSMDNYFSNDSLMPVPRTKCRTGHTPSARQGRSVLTPGWVKEAEVLLGSVAANYFLKEWFKPPTDDKLEQEPGLTLVQVDFAPIGPFAVGGRHT